MTPAPKIFKFSGFYIDPNGDYRKEDLQILLEEKFDVIARHVEIQEADIGEWDDDNPLNRCDCPKTECEKYFTPHRKGVGPIDRTR